MTMFRENLYTGDALERNWKHSPAVMEYCTSRWVLYCTVLYCIVLHLQVGPVILCITRQH